MPHLQRIEPDLLGHTTFTLALPPRNSRPFNSPDGCQLAKYLPCEIFRDKTSTGLVASVFQIAGPWETRVPTNLVMITSDIPTNLPGS